MESSLILRSSPLPTRHCGIRLNNRVTRFLRRIIRRRRRVGKVNAVSRAFHRWAARAGRFLRFRPCPGRYARLNRVRDENSAAVPKGHLAVYVGRKEEEGTAAAERVVVPLVYVNHPLFAQLLREAEEKYGFDHPGGITIPCHVSEFQSVQSKIVATGGKFS